MHIPTHILSGWVFGNVFPLTPRQRLCCMIAATIPDVDGIGIVFGQNVYQRWHHVAAHNLPFCLIVSTVLALWSARSWTHRLGLFFLYAAMFHLHLVMDYFGSGPGWPIVYLWPFSNFRFVTWDYWELSSWQNTLAAAVMIVMTVLIAIRYRCTPLEVICPSLDRKWTRSSAPVVIDSKSESSQ